MKQRHLVYSLNHGYIHDWLALGPAITPVTTPPEADEGATADRARLLQAADHITCDFPRPPQELTKIERFGEPLYWEVVHCQDDHLVEKAITVPIYSHVQAWAFTRFSCPGMKSATLSLTVCCPASVWLNGRHLGYCAQAAAPDDPAAQTYSFTADLKPGHNDLLVRLEQIAAGDVALALAVRVDGPPAAKIKVSVPTLTEEPAQRQAWERALEHVHLDRAIYQRDQPVMIVCDDAMPGARSGSIRLQQPDGLTYGRMDVTFKAGARLEGLLGAQLAAGPMQAVLTPPIEDYYTQGFRARRVLPFTVNMGVTASEPDGDYDDRLITVIREAARGSDRLYAELAKMALGWWQTLDPSGIRAAMAQVGRSERGCLDDLLGLVTMRVRMGHYPQFPADLLGEIDACLLSFNYESVQLPEPRSVLSEVRRHPERSAAQSKEPDAVEGCGLVANSLASLQPHPSTAQRKTRCSAQDAFVESNQITLHAAQIIAGQLYGGETMTASGLTGAQVRSRGEELAAVWLRRHAQTGFALWNSHTERTISALALLADAAEDEGLRDLAAVLLDKLLFGLAVNSFRGAYAAPRAEARASWLRSAALAPEAPLNYLLWGAGGLNAHVRGAVSLGLAGRNYQTPELLRAIARDRWPDMLSRERQQIAEGEFVDTVTFKTPDAMLASAQDYRAGQAGRREHIWQATLGCDAIVFTNHPTSFSDADARQAGWWCGNGSLPRVAQRRDALIALYNLPEDDVLGFTHAFFPAYAFDEHVIEGGWAFGRVGEGYLALHAARGMTLMATGDDAFRELRSTGLRNAWLCQIGRAAVDGSFADFRRAVLAGSVTVNGLEVEWRTIRGERLAFGWHGPLLVDGQAEPITGFKHVENPYAVAEFPAGSMDIGYGEDMMRLHFV
jgi:hypothetical protein